ncbi:MAG: glycosyltransferase family 4 protein [archaeon]|nr:glycosyltransferase family 4 protein [Candidatus Rehaiarchaeum fermentans]
MKVAIVSSDNSNVVRYGGKHVHQNLLKKGLEEHGVDVKTFYPEILFSVNASKIQNLLFYIKKNPLAIFSIYKRVNVPLVVLTDFFKNIKFEEFDIVHCQDPVASYAVKSSRKILTLHGYLSKEISDNLPKNFPNDLKYKILDTYYNIERESLLDVKHIIAVDSRIKDYVLREFGYDRNNVTVLHNAIDTERFKPVIVEEKTKLRKKLGIPENPLVILVPRRYVNKNGVLVAAEAFKELDDGSMFFVFIGGGSLKEDIVKILSKNKNTMILDSIPNEKVHEYYQASDVVLIPSINSNDIEEASSLSMLEGMSCGKIVVCSNIGGMKEIVKDGLTGVLVEEKNVQAIRETIKEIKSNFDKYGPLGQNAREYVLKNHSYIDHARKVIEIYKKVLSNEKT